MKKRPAQKKAHNDLSANSGDLTRGWTFLTNHAHVLAVLHTDPQKVLREVAIEVGISERAVQRVIQDLDKTVTTFSKGNHFGIRSRLTGRSVICSS